MLTEAGGRRSFIIGGVRKSGARISAGLLKPMALVDIVAYNRPDKTLNRLKEVRPAFVYQRLPFELVRGTIGLFMVELILKTVRESDSDDGLFGFVLESFIGLDQSDFPVSNWHLSFALHLAGLLGFTPSGTWSKQTPNFDLKDGQFVDGELSNPAILKESLSKQFGALLDNSLQESHLIRSTKTDRLELADAVMRFYQLHIEGFRGLNCLEVLKTVMGG